MDLNLELVAHETQSWWDREAAKMRLTNDDVWWRALGLSDVDYEDGLEAFHVFYSPYLVVRSTPKGVWLQDMRHPWKEPIFVLGKARKQAAAPTKRLALHDLLCRTKHRVRSAQRELDRAQSILDLVTRTIEREAK